ncbi:MAG TPA: hypothetical protein VGL70_18485 [Candidatus Binatia bacterium]|jgi:CO/xanthine dehydrogenase Mo-binding subunit
MVKFKVIGRPLPREDGMGKVNGGARYAADVIRPGTLWARYCAARCRTRVSLI